jgi:hypothetical protein
LSAVAFVLRVVGRVIPLHASAHVIHGGIERVNAEVKIRDPDVRPAYVRPESPGDARHGTPAGRGTSIRKAVRKGGGVQLPQPFAFIKRIPVARRYNPVTAPPVR